jgi:hypothetical protein
MAAMASTIRDSSNPHSREPNRIHSPALKVSLSVTSADDGLVNGATYTEIPVFENYRSELALLLRRNVRVSDHRLFKNRA